MRVSVIIPSYKPKTYIEECLESLFKQTFNNKDFEIIIILNGCDEPYRSDIQSYIARNNNGIATHLLQTPVAGVSNARNIGLDMAKGEYICFIDDDDYVSPTYLTELYESSLDGSTPICYTLGLNDSTGEISPYYVTRVYDNNYGKGLRKITSVRSYFSSSCFKLIRRDIIGNRRFDTNLANGEDSLFMFEVSDKIRYISLASRNAIYFRRFRDGSAITNANKLSLRHCAYMIARYTNAYMTNPCGYNLYFYISRLIATVINVVDIKK